MVFLLYIYIWTDPITLPCSLARADKYIIYRDKIEHKYLVIHNYASSNYRYTDLLCFYNFFVKPQDIRYLGQWESTLSWHCIVCTSHQNGSTS